MSTVTMTSTSASPSHKQSRHSLVVLAHNLRPSRQKFSKYFTKSRHSNPESAFDEWNTDDLSYAIKMASLQMGTLGNPEVPLSPDSQNDHTATRPPRQSEAPPRIEPLCTGPRFDVPAISLQPPPHPPPPQRYAPRIPRPHQIPPAAAPTAALHPDVLRENSGTLYSTHRVRRGPSLTRPRRRAKTPVHTIGQLEMAAAKKRQDAVMNREASVRTMARQYRALIEVEETHAPDVPRIPSIHRKPVLSAVPAPLHSFDRNYGPMPRESVMLSRGAGLLESPRPKSAIVYSSYDKTRYQGGLAPPSPPLEAEDLEEQARKEDSSHTFHDKPVVTDNRRLEIGLNMLTKELSAASSDDLSGLQIRVMIEAYERLKDQVDSKGTRDPQLSAIFDSWLRALKALQTSVADEAASGESEYEDDDVEDDFN